jgi:hypothetical protein
VRSRRCARSQARRRSLAVVRSYRSRARSSGTS